MDEFVEVPPIVDLTSGTNASKKKESRVVYCQTS